jgi:hypothetical protein
VLSDAVTVLSTVTSISRAFLSSPETPHSAGHSLPEPWKPPIPLFSGSPALDTCVNGILQHVPWRQAHYTAQGLSIRLCHVSC